jgi:hypothetical protein
VIGVLNSFKLLYRNSTGESEKITHTHTDTIRMQPIGDSNYSRVNSTKPRALGAGNINKPKLMSQVVRMREVV